MLARLAFVPEDAPYLEHFRKSCDEKTLLPQFAARDAEIHINVECVVMCGEGARIGAARRRLENRCLDFEKTSRAVKFARSVPKFRASFEHCADFGIHQDVYLALPQTLLFVLQAEPFARDGVQRFGKHPPLLHFNRKFSSFCSERCTRNFNEISDICGLRKEFEKRLIHVSFLKNSL